MKFAMLIAPLAVLLLGAASPPAAEPEPTPAAEAKAGQFIDLATDFVRFADDTVSMSGDARVKAFHARYDLIVPGYYQREGDRQARLDARIAQALRDFPGERAKFMATTTAFNLAFARGEQHFRQIFPDYRLTVPVYLLHSMGTQDGGTRSIGKRVVLFFGADVITRIHDETTIGPFLDHELFHVYHARYFKDCGEVWCSLWQEGMAVYVASRMNLGATDRQLLLTQPRPIRPEVEPKLKEAMCRLRARFESTDDADMSEFFQTQANDRPFPPRYGYLLGYVLASRIGETMPLGALAKLPAREVKPLLLKALAAYGPCPALSVAAQPDSGRRQTASMLLPSGSSMNAP